MVEQGPTGHANPWTSVTPTSDFSNTDGKGTTRADQSRGRYFSCSMHSSERLLIIEVSLIRL